MAFGKPLIHAGSPPVSLPGQPWPPNSKVLGWLLGVKHFPLTFLAAPPQLYLLSPEEGLFEGIKNRDIGGGRREKMKRRDSDQKSGGGAKRVTEGLSLRLYINLCIGPQVQRKILQSQNHGSPSGTQ